MSLPRYDGYKDSGIPWVDQLPISWNVKPLLALGAEVTDRNDGLAETNLLSLSYGSIVRKDINSSDGLLPDSFETYQKVLTGDIVLRLTDLQNDKRSLRSAIVREAGIITSAYVVFRAQNTNASVAQYLNYLLRSYDHCKVFYAMGAGVRQSMNFADIRCLPVLCPTIPEQNQIARFLDRETATIDSLIDGQQRLIELLKEKRQALISHAVTKGLDRSALLKDSGVEWFGNIPETWTVKRLSQVAAIVRGGSPRPAGDQRYFNGSFAPWITVGEVTKDQSKFLRETETMLTPEGAEHSRTIPRGTVILSNSGATLGVPKILEIQGCANDGVLAFLNLDAGVNSGYLYFYLASKTEALRERMKQGSGQPNLNTDLVGALPMPLPSMIEQQRIDEYLDLELSRLSEVARAADDLIRLLQERRAALISAAVTGKIDVRNYTPRETTQTPHEPQHTA